MVDNLPKMTFLEQDGVVAICAKHFADLQDSKDGEWKLLKDYGRMGYGLKVFPVTAEFKKGKGPIATYRFVVEQGGIYYLEVWSAPSNPLKPDGTLCYGIRVNQEKIMLLPSVSSDYQAGEPDNKEWSQCVLNQIRKNKLPIQLQNGLNEIQIHAVDAGFVLEELLIYPEGVRESYLGPVENLYIKK